MVFANVAITQLIEVYTAESDLARNEAHDSDNLKLRGWAAAVEQFTNDLFLVLEDLAVGFPVTISMRSQGPLVLLVGGRTVLLTHPRASQQVSYEQHVLTQFCLIENCDALTASETPLELIVDAVIARNPVWSFTKDGPVCTSIAGDIRVQFPSVKSLPLFRQQCRQFLEEVSELELNIRSQKRHGVAVDLGSVEIQQQPLNIKHRIRLNALGDSVFIALPLLYNNPHALAEIATWISHRIANGAEQPLSINAHDINWNGT